MFGFMGTARVMVTWLAPCGRQVPDTGKESRNLHLAECRGCAEAFVERERLKREAARARGEEVAPLPKGTEKTLWGPRGEAILELEGK